MADQITLPRAVVQQALEALQHLAGFDCDHSRGICVCEYRDAAYTLRDALAQAEPVREPVATFDEVWDAIDWDKWRMQPIREVVRMIHSKTAPQQAEPVQRNHYRNLWPERNFCPRCGKRLFDGIHTCTPPQQAEPVRTDVDAILADPDYYAPRIVKTPIRQKGGGNG